MDEQRFNEYLILINNLLTCPNVEEATRRLEQNRQLIDEGLIAAMRRVATMRESEGQQQAAQTLRYVATEFEKVIPWILLNAKLGELYQQGKFTEGIEIGKEAYWIAFNNWGNEHINIATSLNNLAQLYRSQGRYQEAEPLYLEALRMRKHLLGEDDTSVASSLNNLATLYCSQGRYQEAEPLYLEALNINKRLLGEEDASVATSLNNLATLYCLQGRYGEAELLFQDALSMNKHLLGEEHTHIATSLNNLAELYRSQERYGEAELLYQDALRMSKHLLGEEHPHVATSLNNLALLYQLQGRYKKAELLFQDALKMRKHLLGEQHPDVATSLNSLAELYRLQGRYKKAELLFQDALKMRKHLLGEAHPDIATSLSNLAIFYELQGRYREAESLYQKALRIFKHLLGEQHPHIATSLNNLAIFYESRRRFSEALQYFLDSLEVENNIISRVFTTSSEKERLRYILNNRDTLYAFLSLLLTHFYPINNNPEQNQAAINKACDIILNRKSLTALAQAAQNRAIYSRTYSHLRPTFEQLRSLNNQIIDLTFAPCSEDNRQRRLEIEAEAEEKERYLAAQIPEIGLQDQKADRHTVAQLLPPNSTLIDIFRFTRYEFTTEEWQEDRYIAFILPDNQPDKVTMVDLGKAEEIDFLVGAFRHFLISDKPPTEHLNPWDDDEPQELKIKQYNPTAGIRLYQKIFAPLLPYLTPNDPQTLIIAPDSALNLIPFQLLPQDDQGEKLLNERYTITYLSSGRDILRYQIKTDRTACQPLIIADPNFNLGSDSSPSPQTPPTPEKQLAIEALLDDNECQPAVGTDLLGQAVAEKLSVNAYLQNDALVHHLNPAQCPRVLLIATHGLYRQVESKPLPPLPSPFESEIKTPFDRLRHSQVDNAMLNSGLAFAGLNTWRFNRGTLPPEAGKGFVFALDIAGLDLWENDLSVLVACQSGIGNFATGEGVFGLRRAFAVAGAKTLIMSLWNVPARVSVLLMRRFFDNLEAGLSNRESLQDAQSYIKDITINELRQFPLGQEILAELLGLTEYFPQIEIQCQESDRPLAHPYYWGAWICQGDLHLA